MWGFEVWGLGFRASGSDVGFRGLGFRASDVGLGV